MDARFSYQSHDRKGVVSVKEQNHALTDLENFSDPIDNVLAAIDRDANLAHLQRTAARYREVVAALRRNQNREFGICEDCEETIAAPRIKAIPCARRCIRCQESLERIAA